MNAAREQSRRVFALATVAALVLLLLEGRNQWFFNDDWGQWSTNRFGPDLDRPAKFFFSPHAGHWMSLNRVVFEIIYRTTGLRWYVVYLLPVIFFHLMAAWLLRHFCLRAGVAPWMATAAASVFLFFGTGAEVLTWADPFGYMAGLVLGGAQLALSDHDGPLDRRDAIGLVLGLVSMTSGAAAITMLGAVALASLLRGRVRAMLFHAAPPALLWAIWYLAIGHDDKQPLLGRDDLGNAPSYFHKGITTSLESLTFLGLSALIAVALISYVVWRADTWREVNRSSIAALAAGLPVFWFLLTLTRLEEGVDPAASSRYLYVTAFFALPMLTVAIDEVTRKHPPLVKVATGIFVWAMILNAISLDSFAQFSGGRAYHIKQGVATVVALPGTRELPPETPLEDPEGIVKGGWVAPVGVLLSLHDHGDLPNLASPTEHQRLRWGTPLLVRTAPETQPPGCSDKATRFEFEFPQRGSVVVLSDAPATVDVTLRSRLDNTVGPKRRLTLPGGPGRVIVGIDDVRAELLFDRAVTVCQSQS